MTKHQERNAEHSEYIAWLHDQPCAACGYRGEAIQAAHVGVGGVGLKHGDDDQAIPLCGPHWDWDSVETVPGCHADQEQTRGQFQLMTKEQRNAWYADQVAVHRGRFEAAQIVERTGVVPF